MQAANQDLSIFIRTLTGNEAESSLHRSLSAPIPVLPNLTVHIKPIVRLLHSSGQNNRIEVAVQTGLSLRIGVTKINLQLYLLLALYHPSSLSIQPNVY